MLADTPHAEQDHGEQILDLRALLQILLRRRWYVVCVALGCVALAALITIRAPRIYTATATVIVEHSPPKVLSGIPEVYRLGASPHADSPGSYYATQLRIMKSRPVAEKVAWKMGIEGSLLAEQLRSAGAPSLEAQVASDPLHGLDPGLRASLEFVGLGGYASRAEILSQLERFDAAKFVLSCFRVQPIKDSHVVEIVVEDPDPGRAAMFANAVADAYTEVNLDQKVDMTRSAVAWLSPQIEDLRGKLGVSELALHSFKKANNIVSVSLEDRLSMISQTLGELNHDLSRVRANRLALESRRAMLERARRGELASDSLVQVLESELVQDLKRSLVTIRQEEAELALRYTDEHPKLAAVRKRRTLVEGDLKAEIDKIYTSLDEEYRATQDNQRRLVEAIDQVKATALELNKKEIEYNKLKRERDNYEQLYALVLKRQKEADLTQILKANNVRRLETATPNEEPIRPRPALNLLIGLFLGILCGVGVAFLVNHFDNTIDSQGQVERVLGVSFLGLIPKVEGQRNAKLIDVRDRDHYILDHPRSAVAECCRIIRTNLLFRSPEKPLKRVLVTSTAPKEGKSLTVINLGVTMAQSGARVVLVDTDLRKPRLHRSFARSHKGGVTDVVMHNAELTSVIKHTGIKGLDILTSGSVPPNPVELLHSDAFQRVIEELSERYDHVVFDSPPVMAVADAALLATLVTGVVFVLQAGRTPWQGALAARRRIEGVGGRVLGVVLNDTDLADRHYGQYYRYYYAYYGEAANEDEAQAG